MQDNDDANGKDENLEGNENNNDKMFQEIIVNYCGYDKDEELSYEEEDNDKPLTKFGKQSPILFIKNILNADSQKSPEIYKIIIASLGD